MVNTKKSKFREIYDGLPPRQIVAVAPKTEWVNRMAKITMCNASTVRCWLAGTQKPDQLRRNILAKELGVKADELF